jgi:isoquinoline 1-oxidoreductase beta subunit
VLNDQFTLDTCIRNPAKLDFATQKTKYENYGKPLAQYPVDTGRLRRVVETVAEKSGWANQRSSSGDAWGFAAHRSFLTYVATVVEVEVDQNGKLRIPNVHMAVDFVTVRLKYPLL